MIVSRVLPLIGFLLLPALQAAAADSAATLCETAVGSAEYGARLPARLLSAVAAVESGRADPRAGVIRPWPWTINAAGSGQFFATKAQAITAVKVLQLRGIRSIDVGCLQVNLMHHPEAFASLDAAFDPFTNARYGANYLTSLYRRDHNWPRAIAAYHSQTPELGADYRALVMARWERPLLAATVIGHPAYRDFAPTTTVYGAFAGTPQVFGAFRGRVDGAP